MSQKFLEELAKVGASLSDAGEIVLPPVSATNEDGTPKNERQVGKDNEKRDKTLKFLLKIQKQEVAAAAKQAAPAPTAEDDEKAKKKKGKAAKSEEDGAAAAADAVPVDNTPAGQKKDVSSAMPNEYHPKFVEAAWYQWWEQSGFFKPEYATGAVEQNNPKGTFMICIPPPNVTGALHIGHALTNAIEDTLVRWHRMRGETVLWVPGTDHAGIATQVVVEKKLAKELGKTRHEIGRENFVKEVWKWKDQYGGRICNQLRRLGSSYDWSREAFTMDEIRSNAVNEAFVRLHDQGLIYRATRLVNWDCKLRSAISDLEVDPEELTGTTKRPVPTHDNQIYEFGNIMSFAYKVENSEEEIVVATTRLETMLGDTAIAVNPDDKRYKHLHNKFVKHPFVDRRIPIVTDEHAKLDIGTGAVKITPAHDFNDYEVGKRHNLPMINIFTDEGLINDVCPRFQGQRRFDARKTIRAALEELGLFRGVVDNAMVLPISNRTGDVVEPMMRPQWFVDCNVMASEAMHAVRSGELKLIPNFHEKTWFKWLENIRDWCISRQLWWGHRIPAWFVLVNGQPRAQDTDLRHWVIARNYDAALRVASHRFNLPTSSFTLEQDPDVLDTWFSSALFPFSIFGWPNETSDLKAFYPGTLLETGHDILFFWVARMVFFGQRLMGQLPFREVYLHAIVRDAQGRKMSKSLGNVIDPIDVIEGISLEELHKQLTSGNLGATEVANAIEGQKKNFPEGIPECGTDALRFSLLAYTLQGRSINLDIARVAGYRRFCNKIWQAVKFVKMRLGENFQPVRELSEIQDVSQMDQWILARLNNAITQANAALARYEFPAYTTACYDFWLYEICDVYLETLKPIFSGNNAVAIEAARQTLFTAVEAGLRLLAPSMPFVTEELWQRLPRRSGNFHASIHLCSFPDAAEELLISRVLSASIERNVELARNVTAAFRSQRENLFPKKATPEAYVRFLDANTGELFRGNERTVTTLAQLSSLTVLRTDETAPEGCITALNAAGQFEVSLQCKGAIDVVAELVKLEATVASTQQSKAALEKKMSSDGYETKVPLEVREKNTEKHNMYVSELANLERLRVTYEKMKI